MFDESKSASMMGKTAASLIMNDILLYFAFALRSSFLHDYPGCDIGNCAAMDTLSQSMVGCPPHVTGVSF